MLIIPLKFLSNSEQSFSVSILMSANLLVFLQSMLSIQNLLVRKNSFKPL